MSSRTSQRTRPGLVEQVLPELVTSLAHDLNNQLATMLGKPELALILAEEGRYRGALEEVVGAGHLAKTLISDLQRLLAWLRSRPEDVSSSEVLALAVRLARRKSDQMGVRLESVPGEGALRFADPARAALLLWKLVRMLLAVAPPEGGLWRLESRQGPVGWQVSALFSEELREDAATLPVEARSIPEEPLEAFHTLLAECGGLLSVAGEGHFILDLPLDL